METKLIFESMTRIYAKEDYELMEKEVLIFIEQHEKDNSLLEEFLDFILMHRVVEIALENLKYMDNKKVAFIINAILEKKEINVEKNQMEMVKKLLNDNEVLYIKGSSLAWLYPDNYSRFQADVDIILKKFDCLWSVIDNVSSIYRYDYIKIYCLDEKLKKFSASIDFESDTRLNTPDLDVHISPYYIWGNTRLCIDLWENTQIVNGYNIPSTNNIVLLLVAHIANQWMYRMRDINDLYILLTREDVDKEKIMKMLKQHSLVEVFYVLYNKMKNIYPNEVNLFNAEKENKRFSTHNYGKENIFTSIGIEFRYVFRNYRDFYDFRIFKSVKEALKNTWYMIIYKNRAYNIKKKTKKKFKDNTIIILKLFQKKHINNKASTYYPITEKFGIVHLDGEEYFSTPLGLWRQTDYYGKEFL